MGHLLHALGVATALVGATVVMHMVGLDILMRLTRLHLRWLLSTWHDLDRLIVPMGIVTGLFVVHGAEIWLYAFAYKALGLLPTVEAALYYSTVSYSTLGEAGAPLPQAWRMLGALEAINGMLMLGWSTAFLFQVLSHLLEPGEDHALPRGAISRTARRARANGSG
jgi:voltage-gated potassium channel